MDTIALDELDTWLNNQLCENDDTAMETQVKQSPEDQTIPPDQNFSSSVSAPSNHRMNSTLRERKRANEIVKSFWELWNILPIHITIGGRMNKHKTLLYAVQYVKFLEKRICALEQENNS